MVLVPAVCYDRSRFRLGQGGGYYDRYLSGYGGATVGLCRDALLLERVPRERHDLPVGGSHRACACRGPVRSCGRGGGGPKAPPRPGGIQRLSRLAKWCVGDQQQESQPQLLLQPQPQLLPQPQPQIVAAANHSSCRSRPSFRRRSSK